MAVIDWDSFDLDALAVVVRSGGAEDCSPRDVLEAFFRRSIPDEEWRGRYLPLFS